MADIQRHIQFEMPSPTKLFTPAVTTILILMIIGYAAVHYATDFMTETFGLSSGGVLGGKVWQLVSYPFLNGFCGLLFAGSIVLFLGSAVEREWHARSFAALWLFVSVLCGVLWLLVSLVLGKELVGMGAASCAYGVIGAFGVLFRKRRFLMLVWAVEAHFIAWLLIAIGLILGIVTPLFFIWVCGALIAYLYIKAVWRIRSRQPSMTRSKSSRSSFVDLD